jgi:hypothetical protein
MKDLLNKITENKKTSIIVGVLIILLVLGFVFENNLSNNNQVANVIESDLFSGEEVTEDENENSNLEDNQFPTVEIVNGMAFYNQVRIPVLSSSPLFDYQGGKTAGCGDQIIWVVEDVDPTRSPIITSIEMMFDSEKDYGFEPGNFLASQNALSFNEVILENGIAKIYLEGEFTTEGECDLPRQFIQLEEVALQYYSVDEVEIYLNDELL